MTADPVGLMWLVVVGCGLAAVGVLLLPVNWCPRCPHCIQKRRDDEAKERKRYDDWMNGRRGRP